MEVSLWPIDKVIPYEKNARKLTAQAIDKVAKSIQQFGWRQPIVVDKNGVIVAGHTRLLAAHKLCAEFVPVHQAENLTPEQIRAYRLMDNRSHQETDWDTAQLGLELIDLRDLNFELDLTGFNPDELDLYINGPAFGPGSIDEQGRLDQKKTCICPNCQYEFTP